MNDEWTTERPRNLALHSGSQNTQFIRRGLRRCRMLPANQASTACFTRAVLAGFRKAEKLPHCNFGVKRRAVG